MTPCSQISLFQSYASLEAGGQYEYFYVPNSVSPQTTDISCNLVQSGRSFVASTGN